MEPIIAELTVDDVDVSIYWYIELGFTVALRGFEDEDGLQWASLSCDERTIWLLRGDMSPHSATAAPRTTLHLQVADVNALYQHLQARGIDPGPEPKNEWYGVRQFTLADPDGFRWVIKQTIPPEECPPPPGGGTARLP